MWRRGRTDRPHDDPDVDGAEFVSALEYLDGTGLFHDIDVDIHHLNAAAAAFGDAAVHGRSHPALAGGGSGGAHGRRGRWIALP